MDYNNAGSVALAYWGSNIVGLIFLGVARKWTRVARLMFALLFGYAACVNFALSHSAPEVYLDYAEHAVGLYSFFITGWFSAHIAEFVSFIAAGQLLIAVGMLLKDQMVVFACAGIVVFLAGIAPLGYYAAFPFSITVSLAAILILRNDRRNYLWMPLKIRWLHRLRTA
jgi:hypothetical protein